MSRKRWCFRHGWLGRFRLPRNIELDIKHDIVFTPIHKPGPPTLSEEIILYPDEIEALRLVYLENKTQDEASKIMGVSRGTLWRLLDSGRRKVIEAIISLRPLRIIGFSTLYNPYYSSRIGIDVKRGEYGGKTRNSNTRG